MDFIKVFFTVLHLVWHVTFALTNMCAVIIGGIHMDKCSVVLSYWVIAYGISCLLYYIFTMISAVVTYVEDQDIDSQNTSLFKMIRIIQDELGMKGGEDTDFHEISINLSSMGQNRMLRRNILNAFFGLLILFAFSSGCMILGTTSFTDCNFNLFVVSYILIMLTCMKIGVYIVYAVVH